MSTSTISVIIPVINEEAQIASLLVSIREITNNILLREIIVVDGGSCDRTVEIAEALGATVVKSQKGRAVQMNNGARKAEGSIFYFLHADTYPPPNAWKVIAGAVDGGAAAGCFRLQFETQSRFLKLNAWLTRFNVNAIRFGDQSLFVRREVFKAVGGFDEKHIVLEDQDIVRRISKKHHFTVLPFYVRTSDRKYRENGYVRLQTIFFIIYFLYRLGVSQRKLVSIYKKWIRKPKI